MTEKIFIDTNILVYAFLENDRIKHKIAVNLMSDMIGSEVFISTQVLSEIYSALSKNRVAHEAIIKYIFELDEIVNIQPIYFETIKKCLYLKKRYAYSYWDSLILAASLENGCRKLYSEDMQHGHIVEQSFKIINPFVISTE